MRELRPGGSLLAKSAVLMRRPENITDSTRWLFGVLAVSSLLLSVSGSFASGRASVILLALASAVVLASAWVYTYVTGKLSLWLDVVVAVAIMGFALTCPEPSAVFPLAFAAVWFGALYGSTGRSLARCGLYLAGIAATFPLWHLIAGHTSTPRSVLLFASAPTMVLTVVVGRHLATGLQAREQSLRRDAALAALGSHLLAATDVPAIRALANLAASNICTATPGLRILQAVPEDSGLRIEGAAGRFIDIPTSLPRASIVANSGSTETLADTALLDAAVGVALEWACLRVDDGPDAGWVLLGTSERMPTSAMLAVRSMLMMVALALRNRSAHEELSVRATVDPLTGVANRGAFNAVLAAELNQPAALNPVHLLFIDLDRFKAVNDRLGHQAGDEVLSEVAERLRACVRSSDICARLGGDEFAVILTNASDEDATSVAHRIVSALIEPFHLYTGTALVGASIGIAAARPTDREGGRRPPFDVTPAELCHRADLAMYTAKSSGKGQACWFDDTFTAGDALNR